MLRIRVTLLFIVVLGINKMHAQSVEIMGKVLSSIEVENIHVINRAAQQFTITNTQGEFKINVSLNDTLMFSSIQHKTKHVVVDATIMALKTYVVLLEEQINELDEVLVGKVLTGDLISDILDLTRRNY